MYICNGSMFCLLQGNTGVLLGMLLVSMVVLVALVTVMSGIGVSEHCGVGSGGIYSMISSSLGGRVGGTVGLLYVFGQVCNRCGLSAQPSILILVLFVIQLKDLMHVLSAQLPSLWCPC